MATPQKNNTPRDLILPGLVLSSSEDSGMQQPVRPQNTYTASTYVRGPAPLIRAKPVQSVETSYSSVEVDIEQGGPIGDAGKWPWYVTAFVWFIVLLGIAGVMTVVIMEYKKDPMRGI